MDFTLVLIVAIYTMNNVSQYNECVCGLKAYKCHRWQGVDSSIQSDCINIYGLGSPPRTVIDVVIKGAAQLI